MIRIQGLHKFFNIGRQNEIHVLNDITLDLPEKGMVAIFGKSGCGKTTLLNVIGGLDKYASGELTIEGQSIKENTDDIRNRYIGYIFQNYNLNRDATCYDNVADALRLCGMTDDEEIDSRVSAALLNVGMEKYGKRMPDTLSGGQQQRIAIARAIVKNPRIILADEPTGNLDEANTVMIMDLLKAISKEHLVLLVTHEANLVDYYCDRVIELKDGEIVGTKENASANGFVARDKNDIYLGELERREIAGDGAVVEYYGEAPDTPIKLKIVNASGKLYVQLGTEKVHIIDESSEVKLREGVYEAIERESGTRDIDMSALPPVKGSHFGRLFNFKSSVISGYVSNFINRKKDKRALRICMSLFAAVVVLMSSIFGTSFRDIIDAQNAYNHNTFYVYTPTAEVSKKLNDAVGKSDTGIDYARLSSYQTGDTEVYFRAGSFETFSQSAFESSFRTNAVLLDASLTRDLKVLVGRRELTSNEEIIISSRVADALLEKSTVGYINERKDLIGLLADSISVGGKRARVVGIVESDESAIYLGELAMAKYVFSYVGSSRAMLASDFGVNLSAGEAMLAISMRQSGVEYPSVGDTVKIQGKDVRITAIKEVHDDYGEWLTANSIDKLTAEKFFSEALQSEKPELTVGSDEFKAALAEMMTARHYEYYDYLYSEADAYLADRYFFQTDDMYLWLYLEKDVELAKFFYLPEDYYKAVAYKAEHGAYPTEAELEAEYANLPDIYDELTYYYDVYSNEFYSSGHHYISMYAFLVSDEDYVSFSKQIGETYGSRADDSEAQYKGSIYTLIHSADPDKTDSWLAAEFPNHPAPNRYQTSVVTPSVVLSEIIENKTQNIITGLITMAVFLVLMSICMYFIMRSSLMNRVKEIGIYRAIGVSRRNLVFKFFVEAAVLSTLTVIVGYLVTSAFMFASLGMSGAMEMIFYYPVWLAAIVLIIIYGISLLFGTLPIISLLRKTPSEILAKYDI